MGHAHLARVLLGTLPLVSLAVLNAAPVAVRGGGCTPSWIPTFGEHPGPIGSLFASLVVDDGSGPELYVGGTFSTAGSSPARRVARWDGTSWSALGPIDASGGTVRALARFDGGGGAELYAGGVFSTIGGVSATNVARWDGASWSPLGTGTGGEVLALATFDDGGGDALYVGGSFANAGGVLTAGIARWDGSTWSSVGGGTDLAVRALAVFDAGGGAELYAGGRFTLAGGVAASRVARWDGSSWSPLGPGVDGDVRALCAFDDGGGAALYAAGDFTSAGGAPANRIARWDGVAWSPLGAGTNGNVHALAAVDDGSGEVLWVAGDFTSAGGTPGFGARVARWNGTSWTAPGYSGGLARSFAVWDDGTGPEVVVTSETTGPDGSVRRVARFDGAGWRSFGAAPDARVRALTTYDDGGGEALYAGGTFVFVDGIVARRVARWDGTSWSALGAGLGDEVRALAAFDAGTGPELYAGGTFLGPDHVARWNGTSWSSLGGTDLRVNALVVHDDGSGTALYAGGGFTEAGGVAASRVARWDGAGWSALGAGVSAEVEALAVWDPGTGPVLVAGGRFTSAGGAPAARIAGWDGAGWSPLGPGLDDEGVHALAAFDDGGGSALYAAGSFTSAGGVPTARIARWDGAGWTALGSGLADGPSSTWVNELAVFDDGSGPALYAGGSFTTAGGVAASFVARWDGSAWSALGGGTSFTVDALAPFASDLVVGGLFLEAPDSGDSWIARWGCAPGGAAFCAGTALACPCGNAGTAGAGCDNAQGTGGVLLSLAAQTTAPNGATLVGTGFPPAATPTAIAIRSPSLEPAPVVLGDGLRCVATSGLVRLGATSASGGSSQHALGHVVMAGTFHYQLWYRSTPSTFCDPLAAFNVSSGVSLSW